MLTAAAMDEGAAENERRRSAEDERTADYSGRCLLEASGIVDKL